MRKFWCVALCLSGFIHPHHDPTLAQQVRRARISMQDWCQERGLSSLVSVEYTDPAGTVDINGRCVRR